MWPAANILLCSVREMMRLSGDVERKRQAAVSMLEARACEAES